MLMEDKCQVAGEKKKKKKKVSFTGHRRAEETENRAEPSRTQTQHGKSENEVSKGFLLELRRYNRSQLSTKFHTVPQCYFQGWF